jgi:hypothetical protein
VLLQVEHLVFLFEEFFLLVVVAVVVLPLQAVHLPVPLQVGQVMPVPFLLEVLTPLVVLVTVPMMPLSVLFAAFCTFWLFTFCPAFVLPKENPLFAFP